METKDFVVDASYEIVNATCEIKKSGKQKRCSSCLIWAATIVLLELLTATNAWFLWRDPVNVKPASDSNPACIRHVAQTHQIPEPAVKSQYALYDVNLSRELQHYTQDVCEGYGVNYPLVIAIMKMESGFQPDAVSSTNDYGMMQINGRNHKWLEETLGITDWFDPEQNILAGVYMLSEFNKYEDVHQILMSYNCGPSGAKRLWAEGVYSTAYSRSVVEILNGLEVVSDE